MFFRHYNPHPALQHFVSRIVISRFLFDRTTSELVVPFPPQPEHCLYFYPRHGLSNRLVGSADFLAMPRSMLVGPHLTCVDLKMVHRDTLVILVGFQPGGLHRLLGMPMHELLDTPLDASLALGREIVLITERLAETNDVDRMAEIVQHYLLQKAATIKDALPLEHMLMKLLHQDKLLRVDELAADAFVSVRQLERQFKERVGLPPKVFTRLLRFSRAWLLHERRPDLSWMSIAHTSGYADQMHLIRDFKAFSGVSPGVLQQHLAQSPVHIQGETFI